MAINLERRPFPSEDALADRFTALESLAKHSVGQDNVFNTDAAQNTTLAAQVGETTRTKLAADFRNVADNMVNVNQALIELSEDPLVQSEAYDLLSNQVEEGLGGTLTNYASLNLIGDFDRDTLGQSIRDLGDERLAELQIEKTDAGIDAAMATFEQHRVRYNDVLAYAQGVNLQATQNNDSVLGFLRRAEQPIETDGPNLRAGGIGDFLLENPDLTFIRAAYNVDLKGEVIPVPAGLASHLAPKPMPLEAYESELSTIRSSAIPEGRNWKKPAMIAGGVFAALGLVVAAYTFDLIPKPNCSGATPGSEISDSRGAPVPPMSTMDDVLDVKSSADVADLVSEEVAGVGPEPKDVISKPDVGGAYPADTTTPDTRGTTPDTRSSVPDARGVAPIVKSSPTKTPITASGPDMAPGYIPECADLTATDCSGKLYGMLKGERATNKARETGLEEKLADCNEELNGPDSDGIDSCSDARNYRTAVKDWAKGLKSSMYAKLGAAKSLVKQYCKPKRKAVQPKKEEPKAVEDCKGCSQPVGYSTEW
jgi:hypothetical protein